MVEMIANIKIVDKRVAELEKKMDGGFLIITIFT